MMRVQCGNYYISHNLEGDVIVESRQTESPVLLDPRYLKKSVRLRMLIERFGDKLISSKIMSFEKMSKDDVQFLKRVLR